MQVAIAVNMVAQKNLYTYLALRLDVLDTFFIKFSSPHNTQFHLSLYALLHHYSTNYNKEPRLAKAAVGDALDGELAVVFHEDEEFVATAVSGKGHGD